jgi:hypothetical protein
MDLIYQRLGFVAKLDSLFRGNDGLVDIELAIMPLTLPCRWRAIGPNPLLNEERERTRKGG